MKITVNIIIIKNIYNFFFSIDYYSCARERRGGLPFPIMNDDWFNVSGVYIFVARFIM